MYQRLLVAVDHSEYSDRAVELARDLAHQSEGTVLILHVARIIGNSGDVYEVEDEGEAGKLLDQDASIFEKAGVPVSIQLRSAQPGQLAHQIVEAANEFGADVIVMGSRGRSSFSTLVLGSVAQGVLRMANQRVLVVH